MTVMLVMFMGAIEATIVSTAMPAIVGDLGGFSLYSWVFSAYLLMNAVTVLIYGKLSDIYGRKPILTIGIVFFLIGSILCGFAQSMEMLIIFRFIQGFGAGAVTSIATTIVGDIYTKEERANIQGYLASVWGISAISGPALGALIVEYASWHYVFWINIPLGLLAIVGLWLFFHERVEKKKITINHKSALFLTISISTSMVILVEGGGRWPWLSFETLSLLGISIVTLFVFMIFEKKSLEPMVPFTLWKNRAIRIANLASLTTGMMLIGISSFLPAYVQGVMGRSPLIAGFTLTAMSIGWPIASTLAGKMLIKWGYRYTCLLGGAALIIGSSLFLLIAPTGGPIWLALGSFIVGIGMGLTTTSFVVSIQSSVSWQERGIATASNMFMRNLGNTMGAAIFGGILNFRLRSYLQKEHESEISQQELSVDSVNLLLNKSKRIRIPIEIREILQDGLTVGLKTVFASVFLLAIISLILIFFLPKNRNLRKKLS
ncbi:MULTISPECIES: MDR family MFS transporter [unclassified Bacillus (in: firmicutes)]|uniref:MDR family MFS transporter n=1 Tax=unclassified Bacillus (in: firmicutes) TaxID=185979 RepID=UPI000B877198|nr:MULTISPECIES: MDR family MFS transporter [unclassified Bacillus (in: firmicutes)]